MEIPEIIQNTYRFIRQYNYYFHYLQKTITFSAYSIIISATLYILKLYATNQQHPCSLFFLKLWLTRNVQHWLPLIYPFPSSKFRICPIPLVPNQLFTPSCKCTLWSCSNDTVRIVRGQRCAAVSASATSSRALDPSGRVRESERASELREKAYSIN